LAVVGKRARAAVGHLSVLGRSIIHMFSTDFLPGTLKMKKLRAKVYYLRYAI